MALSIKNEKAERLARKLAAISGESITQAIIHSLEERLIRLQGLRAAPDIYDEIMAISRRSRAIKDLDQRSVDEILGYNEQGVFDEDGH